MKRSFTAALLLLFVSLIWGCAYFNAFYLAKKNLKDAEYRRNKNSGIVDQQAKSKYNEAVKWAREMLEKYPRSKYVDDSIYIIGLSMYHMNDFVVARSQFEELLKKFPDSEYTLEAQYYRARCYFGLGYFENARMILNGLIEVEDREIRGRAGLALADISMVNEDWDDLLSGAQTVVDAEPEQKELTTAIVYKGEALFNLERYEECIETLAKLDEFKITPDLRFTTNTRIAQSKAKLGQYEEGLRYLSELQNKGEFAPYAPRIRLEMGYIYELQNDDNLAIETYRNMAGDFPDSLASREAWYRVGTILMKDLENAELAKEEYAKVGNPVGRAKETWFVDAKIKIAQIDSMFARIELIEKLSGNDNVEARTRTRFALAELYTWSFERPDSAQTQYRLILEEASDTEYAVMSEFYMKHYRLEQENNITEDTERELILGIIDQKPESEFAGKLRSYLGIEDTTPHVIAYKKAEESKESGVSWEEYIPFFQAVVDSFPGTRSSYQARLVLAYSYEHEAGEMETALEIYRALANETPNFFSEKYIETARKKLTYYEEEPTLLVEIEKYIADYETRKTTGFADMGTDVVETEAAVSQDTGYSGMKKIRARNARIRSRYYTD